MSHCSWKSVEPYWKHTPRGPYLHAKGVGGTLRPFVARVHSGHGPRHLSEMSKATPRTRFTVGICDDVTQLSLDVDDSLDIESSDVVRALFFGLALMERSVAISEYQNHRRRDGVVCAGTLRLRLQEIWFDDDLPLAIWPSSHSFDLPNLQRGLHRHPRPEDTSSPGCARACPPRGYYSVEYVDASRPNMGGVPQEVQQSLIERQCRLFAIDAYRVAESSGLGRRINTVMQVCFFSLARVLPEEEAIRQIKKSIENTWSKRGEEIVKRNQDAVDASLAELHEIALPQQVTSSLTRLPGVPEHAPDFVQRVTRLIIEGHGDRLPVSAFPIDGLGQREPAVMRSERSH